MRQMVEFNLATKRESWRVACIRAGEMFQCVTKMGEIFRSQSYVDERTGSVYWKNKRRQRRVVEQMATLTQITQVF